MAHAGRNARAEVCAFACEGSGCKIGASEFAVKQRMSSEFFINQTLAKVRDTTGKIVGLISLLNSEITARIS